MIYLRKYTGGCMLMRIERILLIGIIVAIFSVGFASADETILLTVSNEGYTGFEVTVTTDSSTNQMRVNVTGLPAGYTVKGIDKVYYNLGYPVIDVISVDGVAITGLGGWVNKPTPAQASMFGKFDGYVKDSSGDGSDIIFKLDGMGTIPFNANGNRVAVHLRFDGGSGITIVEGSTYLSEIPEFPTVALPIAAILGLMFIFGRKRDL